MKTYPKDISGMTFGGLKALCRNGDYVNDSEVWLCQCTRCGAYTKKTRKNLTRHRNRPQGCTACSDNPNASEAALHGVVTKLLSGQPQSNSETRYPGIWCENPDTGRYVARCCIGGHRYQYRGTLSECLTAREAMRHDKLVELGVLDEPTILSYTDNKRCDTPAGWTEWGDRLAGNPEDADDD